MGRTFGQYITARHKAKPSIAQRSTVRRKYWQMHADTPPDFDLAIQPRFTAENVKKSLPPFLYSSLCRYFIKTYYLLFLPLSGDKNLIITLSILFSNFGRMCALIKFLVRTCAGNGARTLLCLLQSKGFRHC